MYKLNRIQQSILAYGVNNMAIDTNYVMNSGEIATTGDIIKHASITNDEFISNFKFLTNKGIMFKINKEKEEVYVINPIYFNRYADGVVAKNYEVRELLNPDNIKL